MNTINFIKEQIPVTEDYDVVIVGGGTAGAIAAISSGREGLKTLVIEQFGALGGSQTLAYVTPLMPSHVPGDPSSSSIHSEIVNRLVKEGFGTESGQDTGSWFDPVMLKILLEEMVIQAGCKILYHTVLIDVIQQEKEIQAIIVHNKNGLSAIKAKRYIDCTGDADLAYLAKVPTESGNKDGVNQAVSLRFEMANVDVLKFAAYLRECGQEKEYEYPMVTTDCSGTPKFREFILQKHEEGILTKLDIKHFQMFSIPGKPHNVNFNCPELGSQVNVIEAGYMSEKQIEGKIAILRIARFMKKYVPGFENAYVCEIAPMLGIRESRRIHAVYPITSQDVLQYRKFEDGIATSNYPLDVHGNTDGFEKKYISIEASKKYYEIPYRSLVPVNVNNLLVAGRCMGADFYAQATIRVQHTCRAMGEAAGIACRISIQNNIPFCEVSGCEVRKVMIVRGAQL